MLTLAVLINLLVCAGLFAMAARFIRAEPPIGYHAEILGGASLTDEMRMILGGLYKVMGGGFAAMGAIGLIVTLFGVWGDLFWAKLALLVMALIGGGFSALIPRGVEQRTQVKTPWRIAAAMVVLAVLAFLISLF